MGWALGIAVYFVVWWTALFAVLPFGVHSQQEVHDIAPGTEPGAPARPLLGKKLIANTVLSLVVWGVIDFFYIRYYLQP
jgi:predicted secreted protein